MTDIDRKQLKRMIDEDAVVVVEVLDKTNFNKFHLPGAINVPLGDTFESDIQRAVPATTTPVVVYCMDENCDASPEAARKMEDLGYQRVYDYAAGKKDWMDAGLRIEG